MSSRRTLILLGAVGIGALAALLVFQYVSGIEDENAEEQRLVAAYRAEREIPQSADATQAFDAGDIVRDEIPQKFLPGDAIGALDDIKDKVAILTISPGTVITKGMFADPVNAQVSFRSRLKDPTHVAVTIQVDDVRGVGGFLAPGDDVNILVMTKLVPGVEVAPTEGGAPEGGGGEGAEDECTVFLAYFCGEEQGPSVFLYQKVNILAVGTLAQLQPGEAAVEGEETETNTGFTGLVTFNVPPDAAAVISSVPNESIYLTLLAKEYEPSVDWPTRAQTIFSGDILPGEDPALITPYGPAGLEEED